METKWYQKKEFWALILFVIKGINSLAGTNTFIWMLSDYLLQVGLPILLAAFGIADGLKNNSLMFPFNKLLARKPENKQ